MLTEEHINTFCQQAELSPVQFKTVYRYYLHLKGVNPKQIAEMTNTRHIKVYDSIKRVREGKRFDLVKARLNQIL